MKRFVKFVIMLLMPLILIGCRTHDKLYDLAVCGSLGVPGMLFFDLKESPFPCEVLETDGYGRVLFTYTLRSVITQNVETAVVICQRSTPKEVYFYEDICYYFGEPTTALTKQLKEQNDWGKAIDQSKIARRPYMITFDLCLHINSNLNSSYLESACSKVFHIEENQIQKHVFLDNDNNGRTLYWIEYEEKGQTEKYFIIVNEKYEIAKMNAQGSLEDLSNLPLFKEQNAWGNK